MTGLVRKATLLGVCGLFAASSAFAFVPDPAHCTVPDWIFVVGKVNAGATNDPAGLITIRVADFSNNAIANAVVTIDFSGCCDINLCDSGTGHNCAARTVTGLTDGLGIFTTTVLGAAKDPGNTFAPLGNVYGGCGLRGVRVYANSGTGNVDIKPAGVTAVVLDLNGAPPGGGSNGTSIADVANAFAGFGHYAFQSSRYKGRWDYNCDSAITIADVAAEFAHFGRVVAAGQTTGCPGAFCSKPVCP